MEWIGENQAALMGIVAAAATIGGIIVKLTPTKTDDKWFGVVMGWFGK